MENMGEKWYCGRRPKRDEFEDLDNEESRMNRYKEVDGFEQEEENEEEVNLDNPDFQKGEMWDDYADDLDFEE